MHCGGLCLGRRPCISRRRAQGRSQGKTFSASDLHNARATFLNTCYNMKYKIIKKRQNRTWIKADIPCIKLTPNRYNTLVPAPALIYVSNDVTINSTPWRHDTNKDPYCEYYERAWIGLKSIFEIYRCSNKTIFHVQELNNGWLTVHVKGKHMELFQYIVAYFIAARVSTNDCFLECITVVLGTMHAGETMHCKPCYNSIFNTLYVEIPYLIYLGHIGTIF